MTSKDVVARLVELLDAIDDAIEQGAPQLGGFDFSVLSAAHEEIVQLQRKVKCYEPTNTYDGLDIDQWRQRALAAERAVPETTAVYKCKHGTVHSCSACHWEAKHPPEKAAEPLAHKWDADGERCTICGDKDWMGTTCNGPPSKTDQCLCTSLAQQHLASFGTIAVTIHPDCPLHASSRKSSQYECPSCGHGIHSTAHKQACKIQHGINCPEVHHEPSTSGYLHESGDNRPYDVDGVKYCGRCHEYLS